MVLCGQGFPLLITVLSWWESKSIRQTGNLKQYGSFCKTTMKPQDPCDFYRKPVYWLKMGNAILWISWLKGLTSGPQMKTQGREAGTPMTGSVGSCTGPASLLVLIVLSHYIPTAAHPLHGTGWRTGLTRSSPCLICGPGTAWWARVREGSGKVIRVRISFDQWISVAWFNVYYQTEKRFFFFFLTQEVGLKK